MPPWSVSPKSILKRRYPFQGESPSELRLSLRVPSGNGEAGISGRWLPRSSVPGREWRPGRGRTRSVFWSLCFCVTVPPAFLPMIPSHFHSWDPRPGRARECCGLSSPVAGSSLGPFPLAQERLSGEGAWSWGSEQGEERLLGSLQGTAMATATGQAS